jgi:type II secretory pathway component PulJ
MVRDRSEAGETLMEVLIASALMAIVVAVILGGMATILSTSRVHRSQADSNSVLVSAMERLKSTEVARVACASPTPTAQDPTGAQAYKLALQGATLPAGWTGSPVTISSIQYESVANVNGVPGVSFGTVCNDSSGLTLQLIKIKVTSPDGRVTPSLSFIKGDNS